MNIVIFSWRGPGHPNAGGAEVVTQIHGQAWAQAGHKVTLFTSTFPSAKEYESIKGISVIRRGSQVLGVKLQALLWYLSNSQKVDLVVDEFHGIPFFTPLFVKTKKLAFIHEVAKEVWRLNPWPKPFNLLPSIIGTALEPFIFKFFYKDISFLTVSESTKKDLVSYGISKDNITIIKNGVNISQAPKKLSPKAKKKTVMFLGAISQDKGIEDAVEVFSLINEITDNCQFWIVGKASLEMEKHVIKKLETLGIKQNTKYFGFVSDKKKFELLGKAHVLVNPSVREGWGLVNIEANAVGTPVVGYNVAGLRDSVVDEKTGYLVEFKDTKKLAMSILKLLNDNKLYNRMSENSKIWAKKFSWEKSTKASLALIEKNG